MKDFNIFRQKSPPRENPEVPVNFPARVKRGTPIGLTTEAPRTEMPPPVKHELPVLGSMERVRRQKAPTNPALRLNLKPRIGEDGLPLPEPPGPRPLKPIRNSAPPGAAARELYRQNYA